MNARKVFSSVAMCFALSLSLSAQDDQPLPALGQDAPRFSASSDLVVLHATVRDRSRRYVRGLPRGSFKVFEDDHPQSIEFFSGEDTPVTVGLLLDSSISVLSIRELLVAGAVAFARASHPKDELFALAFNDRVRPVLPEDAPFTSDVDYFGAKLGPAIVARGRTALFDAVAAGLDYADRGSHARKVLVVLSDGGDNASRATFDEILSRTRISDTVIYTVAVIEETNRDAKPRILRDLAAASGGETFSPKEIRAVSQALQTIARDIRETYTIGYVSSQPADGSFRRVRVAVSDPARPGLVVTARTGYVARRPQDTSGK